MRRHILLSMVLLLAALLLCGCSGLGRETATPSPNTATSTLAPTPSPTPTFSIAEPLTATPVEVYEPPEPTATATVPPAEPTAVPTDVITLTPTVTSGQAAPELDASSIDAAHRAQRDGDYAQAEALWRGIAAQGDLAAADVADLGLARALAGRGELGAARDLLRQIVARDGDSATMAQAWVLLADIATEASEWSDVVEALTRYLALEDAAEPYVRWQMAQAYERLGELEQAVAQIEVIDLLSLPTAVQAEILEKAAELHEALEMYDEALADYREILSISKYESYRALILQKSGEALRLAGDEDKAVEQLTGVLSSYPDSYAAYLALLALDEMGAADIKELDRALIYQGANQHEEAVTSLERALTRATRVEVPRIYFALGQSYAALGEYQEAFKAYDVLIRSYGDHALVGDAWMAKAEAALDNEGDPTGLYQEFYRLYPDHERAPEALMRAGSYLQATGAWDQAAEMYDKLASAHGDSRYVDEAQFRAGLAAYAQDELIPALNLWHEALEGTDDSQERARLMTFIGLALMRNGRRDQAQGYWQSAADLAPDSYYGRRARDLATDQYPIFPAEVPTDLPLEGLNADDWAALDEWVAAWNAGESVYDLADDRLAARARALAAIGWRREAVETLEQMRLEYREDPARLLATLRLCDELAVDSATIATAESLLAASIEADGSAAPLALRRLLYPTAYGHLVCDEAEHYAIDPLYLLAVIRQESRFNPDARSYAGARGLGQVMPETGEWIASKVGPPDYTHDDLWRPIISVRHEAWFFGWLLDQYQRDWFAALVAYNAGPGNLARWTNGEPIADHDLFYELIPVQQAQDYVRLIYQQYGRYQGIYR